MKLNKNFMSIHLNIENGELSLLYLPVQTDMYNTQSIVAFTAPKTPGQNAVISKNTTGPTTV